MNPQLIKIHEHSFLNVIDSKKVGLPAIIFLHGLTGNYHQLQFYYEALKEDFRFIAIDFRSRGDSSVAKSPSSLVEHKKDVISLLKELKIENPILIGYSMGAFVAALVAAEYHVEKLILLDGAATMDDHQDQIVVPTFGRLSNRYESREDYVETVVANYGKMGVPDSSELRKAVNYEIAQRSDGWYNKAFETTIRQDWSSFHDFNISEIGPKLNCPTLLVVAKGEIGQAGALFQEQHYIQTKQSIKNLTVFNTEANHYTLVFDKRPEVITAIRDFLNQERNRHE